MRKPFLKWTDGLVNADAKRRLDSMESLAEDAIPGEALRE